MAFGDEMNNYAPQTPTNMANLPGVGLKPSTPTGPPLPAIPAQPAQPQQGGPAIRAVPAQPAQPQLLPANDPRLQQQPLIVGANGLPFAPARAGRVTRLTGALMQNLPQQAQPIIQQLASREPGQVTVHPAFNNPYAKDVAKAYSANPTLPGGFMETLLEQESSLGKNTSNQAGDAGKYGYLVGMTAAAAQELNRLGVKANLDTPGGAIAAAAKYAALKQQVHDGQGNVVRTITNPVELYASRYNTAAGHPAARMLFSQKLNKYINK